MKSWTLHLLLAAFAALLLPLAGCDDSDGGAEGEGEFEFAAGTFQLSTLAVDDGCMDGGLQILFMPNGNDQAYDLAYPTEFPALSDLPKSYTIRLQEPFSDLQVTLQKSGERGMSVQDAPQTAVLVDADNYGDCVADMAIDVDITVVDANNLNATAAIEIFEVGSAADQLCPQLLLDNGAGGKRCTVTLTMTGRRLN